MLADEPALETEKRIFRAATWLAKGMARAIAVRAAAEEWDISPQQARFYIQRAERILRVGVRKEAARLIEIHVKRREIMALEAWYGGDLALALKIYDSQAKLQGLLDIKDPNGESIRLGELINEVEAANRTREAVQADGEPPESEDSD